MNVYDDDAILAYRVDLSSPEPLRILFPILLDGDQLVTSPEHLGVGFLCAVLRGAGAECRVVEVAAGEIESEELSDALMWRPDIIGLTMTTVIAAHAKEFGAALRREVGSDVFIVAGGPLVSYRGASMLSLQGWEFLDALVRGEGEAPLLRLAEAIHSGSTLTEVPNLVYRDDAANVQETEIVAAVHSLDSLPHPARDQFEAHGGTLSPRFAYLRISTSRGCTSFCTFCNAPHARNRIAPNPPWRGCSPRYVVDEIQELYEKYRCRSYVFVDSTFEDPGGTTRAKNRLKELAGEILERGLLIHYACCMQALNWSTQDHELLDLLWRSGLEYALVGIESGSEADLRVYKKRSSLDDNDRIVPLLREHNVFVQLGFISFNPYSTFDTVRENYAFLRRNGVGFNLGKFTSRLELYAGAELVETLRNDGLLLPNYDEDCYEFGYRYVDGRIEQLANALRYLHDPEYDQHYTVVKGPYKFESEDSAAEIFLSRAYRAFGDDSVAREVLDGARRELDDIHQRMTEFYWPLVDNYVSLAEQEDLDHAAVLRDAPLVVDFVAENSRSLGALQVRTAMALRRGGFSLEAVGNRSLTGAR